MTIIATPPELWVGASGTASTIVVVGEPGDPLGTDSDQTYFFTIGWQAYVMRAEQDLAQRRIAEFATIEDLFADLDA
jgi:hypothetical protein